MRDTIHVADRSLSTRLELAEAAGSRAFCEAAQRVYGRDSIFVLPAAGGVALHYGAGDPLNAVKGPGLGATFSLDEWLAMEEAFRVHSSSVVVDCSPFAQPEFIACLQDSAYRIGGFETVTWQRVPHASACNAAPLHASLRIERVAPSMAEAWSLLMGRGFADGGEPMAFSVDFGRVRAAMGDANFMVMATWDSEPAGAASLSMHEGVAHFGGASVMPAFRGRGIQQALTHARLAAARAAGCDLAKLDVLAGSVSHRNAERAGFRVAYSRPQFVRSW
jgi:ribosomal protein S18 acetylase RimI-like enzyme